MIELDGEDHFWDTGIEKERVKENDLNTVIRFENKWVYEDIAWVIEQIKAEFNHPWFYALHKIGPLLEKDGKLHKLFTNVSIQTCLGIPWIVLADLPGIFI